MGTTNTTATPAAEPPAAPPDPPAPKVVARPHHRAALFAAGVLLVAATLIAYLPSLRGGFIWDDDEYIETNWTLRSLDGLHAIWTDPHSLPQWYPVVHTTFWLEYHLWGLNPAGYKVVNVLLHAGSALLLWVILRKFRVPGAWLAAAVFALHPVHVESVAWITERKNTLSGFFYLASLLAYLKYADLLNASISPSARAAPDSAGSASAGGLLAGISTPDATKARSLLLYFLALLLFTLALLSKTVTCSLPAAVLLILYWRRGRIGVRDVLPLIPFFLLGAALAFTTAHLEATHVGATGPEFDLSPAQRVLIAGRALWFYAWKVVYPMHLSFIYPRWTIDPRDLTQWLYPLAFLATVAALFIYRRKITRGPLVAVLFFAGALVPALGFVNVYPMRYSFVADHFQYLASIGLIVLMVASTEYMSRVLDNVDDLSPAKKWTKHALLTDVPFLLPLAVLTFWQAQTYKDRLTLWTATAERNPTSWMVHLQLGHANISLKQDGDRAMAEYQTALALAPGVADPHYNVGYRLAVAGRYEEALKEYREALRIDPTFALAHYGAGNALAELGDAASAADHYRRAIAINPRFSAAHLNLGFLYEKQSNLPAAEAEYRAALRIDPDYTRARNNLAAVLHKQGNTPAAAAILRGEAP